MLKMFEELDYQQTPIGELSLRRKHVAMFGNLEVYEVKLGDAFLMTSMFHAVEEAVADLGLRELGGIECDVIVGGLGLGYTAMAALAHPNVRSMVIVEYLQPVIDWHQRSLVPLGATLTNDARCSFLQADFFECAMSPGGFQDGVQYHAVLLDIDHSPESFLDPRNAAFYSQAGLSALAAHLYPGGVFAMWSDDAPDENFLALLKSAFSTARAEVITFPNPFLDADSAGTVYVAKKGCSV